jgi:hypothetical protein
MLHPAALGEHQGLRRLLRGHDGAGRSVCVTEKTTRNNWHFPEEIGGWNGQIRGERGENEAKRLEK